MAGATELPLPARVDFLVEARDRRNVVTDITGAVADAVVAIVSVTVTTVRDRDVVVQFVAEVADPARVPDLLAAVRQVEGVRTAYQTPVEPPP